MLHVMVKLCPLSSVRESHHHDTHTSILHHELSEDVKDSDGVFVEDSSRFVLKVSSTNSIAEVKMLLSSIKCYDASQLLLVYAGQVLKDDRLVIDYDFATSQKIYASKVVLMYMKGLGSQKPLGPSSPEQSTNEAKHHELPMHVNALPFPFLLNQTVAQQSSSAEVPSVDKVGVFEVRVRIGMPQAAQPTEDSDDDDDSDFPEDDLRLSIPVLPHDTIADLKRIIELKRCIAVERQRLVFGGQVLLEDRSVGSYEIMVPRWAVFLPKTVLLVILPERQMAESVMSMSTALMSAGSESPLPSPKDSTLESSDECIGVGARSAKENWRLGFGNGG